MSGRYVPPARRRQSEPNGDNTAPQAKPRKPSFDDDSNLVSPEEVKNHFWPAQDGNGTFDGSMTSSRTLHDSAEAPGKLAYLFLFKEANPRWESDQVVYTKSSLEMLPPATQEERPQAGTTDGQPGPANGEPAGSDKEPIQTSATSPSETQPDQAARKNDATSPPLTHNGDPKSPVAIFKQTRARQIGRSFAFEGWYRIDRIAYLEPHSPELVHMLEQKWTRTDRYGRATKRERDHGAWQASLSLKWAVVKFVRHEEEERERGLPKIERLPEEYPGEEERVRERKKSVNEMLEELRMEEEERVEVDGESMEV